VRFINKNILVTGAGSGIGQYICEEFAREGANLIVTDKNIKSAEQTTKKIESIMGNNKVLHLHLDVTDALSVSKAVNESISQFKCINILINCAGVSTMNTVLNMSEKEWDLNFSVNAKGVFLVSRAVAKNMVEQGTGGKIINIASMAGKLAAPFLVHYSASKFAVIGFTQGLALELAKYKINVNAVCPAFVKTPMQEREIEWEASLRNIKQDEVRDNYIKMTPLGRLGNPEDVAKVVLFLASKDADFMTGQAINITGGSLLD